MHYCDNCGVKLPEDHSNFCSNCGRAFTAAPSHSNQAPVQAAPTINPAAQIKKRSPELAPAGLDKDTFMKRYSLGRQKCLVAAVLGYISAGITSAVALFNFVDFINVYAFIDVAILLTLSLLIHLVRSRVASIILLTYALYNVIVMVMNFGEFAGWWGLVAGVLAVIGSFQCVKEWKAYQARTQTATPSL